MKGRGKRSMREEVKKSVPVPSWQERKSIADTDEQALKQDIQDLHTWTNMIDGMSDEQLEGYIENRPDHLRTIKLHNTINPRPFKIPRNGKPKCSASVRKIHKEDQDDKNT